MGNRLDESDIENITKKVLEDSNIKYFQEPFSRKEPDMIAITNSKIIILEFKGYGKHGRGTLNQVKSYLQTKELLESISDKKVEIWVVCPSITGSYKEEIEKLGAKVIGANTISGECSTREEIIEQIKELIKDW